MNISFSKDYRHNYLVIRDEKVLNDDYQLRMMIKNQVKGLLPCMERMINGEGLLYYEVTSLQPISIMYENACMKLKEVKAVLKDILELVKELPRYMLKYPALILKPEYIFMDIESGECSFLYYPFYEAESDGLSSLIQFMLEKVDSEDMEAVEAVYQLADVYERQHLSIIEVLSWFEREYENNEELRKEADCYDTVAVTSDDLEDNCFYDIEEEEENISLFSKIIRWLRRSKKKSDDDFFRSDGEDFFDDYPMFVDNGSGASKSNAKNNVDEGTVYIPWVENSEQKLYGVGHNNKYRIDLSRLPVTVGKLSDKVDMVISDNSISRMHARFFREGNKFRLQDLNSTNGCFKNGMRLAPNETVTIEPGDEIGLGKLKFIYR